MRRLGVLLAAGLFGVACSSGGAGRADETRPATSPPTSPAPTTTVPAATTPTSRGPAATTAPDLSSVRIGLRRVASGLTSPVAVAWRAGDERMYVAEQAGRVRVVDTGGNTATTPVLSIDVSGGNEQGLLGLAFSPDGTKLYVHYTDPAGDSHVDEYTMRGDVAVASTRREVLFQRQPFPNHNGGEVVFGPDGMLYIGFGDGGSAGDPNGNGQKLDTWLGKILRIDPRPSNGAPYTVPADNPFVGRAGARSEIWMYGLRNPWRFTFDRATGDAWIGDVGQGEYEEIDYAPAGKAGINWGWNLREGAHDFRPSQPLTRTQDPLIETTHDDGNSAVVGGYVYRGTAFPALRGVYVFGDNCQPALTGAVVRDGKVVAQRDIGQLPRLTTFGEDLHGEVYGVSRGGGIFQLVAR